MGSFARNLQITMGVAFLAVSCHAAEPISRFDRLTLERSTCFGTCPAYRIVEFANGRVEYEGKRFVKAVGKREKRISADQLAELAAELSRVNYLNLLDRYRFSVDGCPAGWTDHPTVLMSLQIGSTLKNVEHYHGCKEKDTATPGATYPPGLEAFENRVDEIVQTAEWVGSREERLRTPVAP